MNPISTNDTLINVMESRSLVVCDAKQCTVSITMHRSFVIWRFPVTRIWWTVEQLTVCMNITTNVMVRSYRSFRLCQIGLLRLPISWNTIFGLFTMFIHDWVFFTRSLPRYYYTLCIEFLFSLNAFSMKSVNLSLQPRQFFKRII